MYYGDTTRLYATLKDKDNNPLVNKTVVYYFNGNVYSRVSNDFGREAVGNCSGVWMFNFLTSLSFSLIEQIVGNNIWGTFEIGSVTLGLLQNYLANGTLEFFL